jgi:hypothetical protein
MINAKLQSIIDTKSAIGNAIVNKGGTITGETPFFNYATEIDNISTGSVLTGNATTGDVLNGFTFYNNDANTIQTGTLALTGNAIASEVASGKTFYSTNAKSQLTGTATIAGAYSTWVVQDENSAKYQFFNGYDLSTNPTPSTTNVVYNQWLLNNSASGSVVLSNTVMTAFNYNGPSSTINQSNIALLRFPAQPNGVAVVLGSSIFAVTSNNNFIYVGGGGTNQNVRKLHANNMISVGVTNNIGTFLRTLTTHDNHIFVTGGGDVKKYHEGNLVYVGNTASYGDIIFNITTNNGFIYVAGQTTNTVRKYHEGNLAYVGQTATYGSTIRSIDTANGFIYAGGDSPSRAIQKFHESNLVRQTNDTTSAGDIYGIHANYGFIYVMAANLRQHQQQGIVSDNSVAYRITTVKE